MNAIALTTAGMIKALTAPACATVADLDRWERALPDRPYPGIATKMEACFSVRRDEPLSVAKKYLTLTHSRLERGARMRPERFDPNRLFCCKAMLSLIERYEQHQARMEGVA